MDSRGPLRVATDVELEPVSPTTFSDAYESTLKTKEQVRSKCCFGVTHVLKSWYNFVLQTALLSLSTVNRVEEKFLFALTRKAQYSPNSCLPLLHVLTQVNHRLPMSDGPSFYSYIFILYLVLLPYPWCLLCVLLLPFLQSFQSVTLFHS